MSNITYDYITSNENLKAYIAFADDTLKSIGYTEHGICHVTRTAQTALYILSELGFDERQCELARIAAYMHDIGNIVNRYDHGQSSALMAFRLLSEMQMPASEIAVVVSAIGNHDEATAMPVSPVAAALIIADKTDVRRSRVRSTEPSVEALERDIHDRVNYACVQSNVYFSEDRSELFLSLVIDEQISSIMEYFEIFMTRMALCRRASEFLGVKFRLVMNNTRIL